MITVITPVTASQQVRTYCNAMITAVLCKQLRMLCIDTSVLHSVRTSTARVAHDIHVSLIICTYVESLLSHVQLSYILLLQLC
jgi:hypothetical protein